MCACISLSLFYSLVVSVFREVSAALPDSRLERKTTARVRERREEKKGKERRKKKKKTRRRRRRDLRSGRLFPRDHLDCL